MKNIVIESIAQRGYAKLQLKHCSSLLLKSIHQLLNDKSWMCLRNLAHDSECIDKNDDPTSLGLQLFTNKKQQHGVIRKELFASNDVKNKLLHGLAADFTLHNNEWCYTTSSQELLATIAIELNKLSNNIVTEACEYYNTTTTLIDDSEHETLWNFFASNSINMYPHTDISLISLILVPSVMYDGVDKTDDDGGGGGGLQVVNSRTQEHEKIETLMKDHLIVLPGKYYAQISKNTVKATEHQVIRRTSRKRRLSLAHFYCRRSSSLT